MRLGYFMLSSLPESKDDDVNRLQIVGCDRVFIDKFEDEEKRPQWKNMLSEVKRNDEIVILRLSNAVRGLVQLVSFFEICRVKRIRIISLKDKFDSWDEMFPSSISQLIDAIGAFPGDIQASKIAAARIRAVKTKKKSSFQNSKEDRENRCVSMYNNGASIKDIKEEIGFRSNSSVYRFLKNKGVTVNRRSTK
ncbi:recombinase family protein [Bacteroides thetaiotaomicron]|jgi:serine type site-specific recombinase|uniref:recombinase family protein n=1 Tax=Bacteroides thetaiotaomicron TaxID=818 RepID=UPI00189EFC95|nr:recombinase family protein [Bacteroides thetaiotaomicron]MDC2175166.1 recombinase family protein [Bacteroides thetaiotaomicron]MDC2190760.1 recombinase family protein [Bacteroides thetaiotaomicron]